MKVYIVVEYDVPGAYFTGIAMVTESFAKAKECQETIRSQGDQRGAWAVMYEAEVDGDIKADTFMEW